MNVMMIVLFSIAFLAFICFIGAIVLNDWDSDVALVLLIAGVLLFIATGLNAIGLFSGEKQTESSEAVAMIDNGADVYLDGVKIENPDILDLEDYKIEFKDDSVIITSTSTSKEVAKGYCNQCGTVIEENDKFCDSCGVEIKRK